MEKGTEKVTKKKAFPIPAYLPAAVAGCLMLSLALPFLENQGLAGSLCSGGLLLFLIAQRKAESKRQVVLVLLLLWLGLTIRYSTGFDGKAVYFAMVAGLAFLYSAVLCTYVMVERILRRKGLRFLSLFAFPLVYLLTSVLLAEMHLGNLANLFTYWICFPPIARNIIWLDEYLLTFICALFLSLLAECFAGDTVEHRRIGAVGTGLIAAVLLITGAVLNQSAEEPDYSLQVAVATMEQIDFMGNSDVNYSKKEHYEFFREAVEEAAKNDADLLVLCEEYFPIGKEDENEALEFFSEVIREYGVPVLAGIEVDCGKNKLGKNECVFFDAQGNILSTYLKNNLILFVETGYYQDGPEQPAVFTCELGGHEIDLAYVICFDVNDADYMRMIPADTELLLVPSWDWDTCNIEQLCTRFRSIDCNTTMLKHSYEGFTFVSGPYGLCGEILDNRGVYETVRMIEVPIWEK